MDAQRVQRRLPKQLWIAIAGMFVAGAACALVALHHSSLPAEAKDALVALGRQLFVDPRLSADGQTRCSSCHNPAYAYSDGRTVSRGAFGRLGTRNTPSLLTVTMESSLFWDGRRQRLEDAVLDPFEHPLELGLPDDPTLQTRLQTPVYREAFARAFGTSENAAPTREQIGQALAAYVRALPRPVTAFDQYEAGDKTALTHDAQEGLRLFAGKGGCAGCHRLGGSLAEFSDGGFHATGTGLQTIANRLPQLSAEVEQQSMDPTFIGRAVAARRDWAEMGRFVVTHAPGDMGLFRTPSLRYVADTAPYMHDGSVRTLEAAVDQEIYWRGLTSGKPLALTVNERAELIAFLRALSPMKHTATHAVASKEGSAQAP